MAEVYAATQEGAAGFTREVCVKRILPELASNTEFSQLFTREAAFAGQLCHSNLVQVFDSIEQQGQLAIVMELIDGCDLRAVIRVMQSRRELLQPGLVAYLTSQVLNGLRYAHEKHVVHRDISPHNILISKHGEVKLGDFGVAKAMLTHASRTGTLRGKLAYMSPEQARGDAVDHRTDLYSLGLVLYELLHGRRLFQAAHQGELFKAVARAGQPRLEGIEPTLARIVEQLLAPNPKDRFPSATEALLALPPWEIIGAAGPIELGALIESFPNNPGGDVTPSEGLAPGRPSVTVVDPLSGPTETITPHELELVRGARPIIATDRNAPTATRDDDVKSVLEQLPPEEVAEDDDRPTVAAYSQAPVAPAAVEPKGRRWLIPVLIAAIVALLLGLTLGAIAGPLIALRLTAPDDAPTTLTPASRE